MLYFGKVRKTLCVFGMVCADSAPKENAAAGEKSERPAEQPLSLDETLPAESKGGPEPSGRSVPVISTVLTSFAETVQNVRGRFWNDLRV